MSYLGTPPQSGFITTAKQRVTSSTNNYVDLDHAISSIADVIVFVNFVKQDTTNLTLTTSTRITLGGTLVSSDIVEIHYLGKAVNTQTPSAGTVTNDMLAGSIANSKLANSSITLNGSAVSLGGSATVGGSTDVLFAATMTANQTMSHEVTSKLAFNDEIYDVGSCYDHSTNYRFTVPSGKQGYYHIGYSLVIENSANSRQYINWVRPYKNGSDFHLGGGSYGGQVQFYQNNTDNPTRNIHAIKSFIINLSAADYIEIYAQSATNNSSSSSGRGDYSMFWGYKLIT